MVWLVFKERILLPLQLATHSKQRKAAFPLFLSLVLDVQRLVEDKPAATGVSAQGRTSGRVHVECILKGAGDLHTNIVSHSFRKYAPPRKKVTGPYILPMNGEVLRPVG